MYIYKYIACVFSNSQICLYNKNMYVNPSKFHLSEFQLNPEYFFFCIFISAQTKKYDPKIIYLRSADVRSIRFEDSSKLPPPVLCIYT